MSQIKFTPNASGTGVFEITAPNSNTDRTIALPDKGGNIPVGNSIVDDGTSQTLTIDSSNNIGVGTASPSDKLHVASNIRLDGSNFAGMNYYGSSVNTTGVYTGLDSGGGFAVNVRDAGYLALSTNNTERARIESSGNYLIGTSTYSFSASNYGTQISPTGESFWIRDTVANLIAFSRNTNGDIFKFFRGSQVGGITVNGTSTTYSTSSDYRLKENIVEITDAVDRVKQLKPSRFNFIAYPDTTVDGFIAHEVSDVVPEAITGEKDAMRTEEYEVTPAVLDDNGNVITEAVMGEREVIAPQGIDQSKLVPLLTAALQEAVSKIEALEARVATLEGGQP